MAYNYNSNYPQSYGDNYQYYDQYYSYNNDYSNQESRYVQYSDTEFYGNAYQQSLSPSLVGYYYSTYDQSEFFKSKNASFYENGEYCYDPVETQYVVSYNANIPEEAIDVVEDDEDDEDEHEPIPFHGGYDINEKYGKPLPPSEEICHPPSRIDPNGPSLTDFSYGSVPSPYLDEGKPKETNGYDDDESDDEYDDDDDDSVKEPTKSAPIVPLVGVLPINGVQNLVGEQGKLGEVKKPKKVTFADELIQKEKPLDLKDNKEEAKALEKPEDEDEDEEEENGDLGDQGNHIKRQIPYGYGIEALDICDGVFGGYFPCLWKRNQRIYNHQRDVSDNNISDYDYCWNETADYLFGNPNPYGGTMPEKGSYGDPVYCYQKHHPQKPNIEYVEGNSSWGHNLGYYYGHNGGQYQ
ncbi:unnamed protein product [Amaranthus hypochondriacus]